MSNGNTTRTFTSFLRIQSIRHKSSSAVFIVIIFTVYTRKGLYTSTVYELIRCIALSFVFSDCRSRAAHLTTLLLELDLISRSLRLQKNRKTQHSGEQAFLKESKLFLSIYLTFSDSAAQTET